jgi:hypothetical protein
MNRPLLAWDETNWSVPRPLVRDSVRGAPDLLDHNIYFHARKVLDSTSWYHSSKYPTVLTNYLTDLQYIKCLKMSSQFRSFIIETRI